MLRTGQTGARIFLGSAAMIAALSCVGTSAHAQDGESVGVGDVVVTAQRREQRLQDVPITVNALTSEALRAADVRSMADLTAVVPGLRAHVQTHYFQPFIRGVGGTSTLGGNEAAVATYIDGVYIAFKNANVFELNNVERIEVLKGPQGTLFGRNATGGAINIITKSPSRDDVEVRAEATYGRFEDAIGSVYASAPFSDELSFSLALRYEEINEGYQQNIVTGGEYGLLSSFQGMGTILWEPTPDTRIRAELIRSVRDATDDDSATINGSVPSRASLAAGTIFSTTPYVTSNTIDPTHEFQDYIYMLDIRQRWGAIDFASISAYIDATAINGVERDRSSLPAQTSRSDEFSRQFTQELQLSSQDEQGFDWIVGLYYFRDREGYDGNGFQSRTNVPGAGTVADLRSVAGRTGVAYTATYADQLATSWAGFAEGTFHFSEATRLTLGSRYTEETREFDATRYNVTAPLTAPGFVYTSAATATGLETTFSRATWRLALDHKFTPDIMGYVSYNTGFRSGAYNPTLVSQTQVPLRPELIDASEIGLKTEWLDGRLRVNAAAFYYDYRDLHVAIRTPSTGVITQQNAGGAESYGLDLDFAAKPIEQLTISGGLNLLQAEYTEFVNAAFYIPNPAAGGGTQITTPSAAGEPLNFSPEWTANVAVQYDIPFASGAELSLQGNYFYTDGFSRQIGQGNEIDAYDSLNASVTWHAPERRFFLRAWGRNLTDQQVLGSQYDTFALFYIVQRPVTYGMTLGFCLAGGC